MAADNSPRAGPVSGDVVVRIPVELPTEDGLDRRGKVGWVGATALDLFVQRQFLVQVRALDEWGFKTFPSGRRSRRAGTPTQRRGRFDFGDWSCVDSARGLKHRCSIHGAWPAPGPGRAGRSTPRARARGSAA